MAVAALLGAVAAGRALFGGRGGPPAAASQDGIAAAIVRLQITTQDGELLSPQDVQAQVDDRSVDASQRFPLPPGTHRLQVHAPGYERYEQALEIRAGDHLQVPVQLRHGPPADATPSNKAPKPSPRRLASVTSSSLTSAPPSSGSAPSAPPPTTRTGRATTAAPSIRIGNSILLTCAGYGAAVTPGIARQPFAEVLTIELDKLQSGRAHLPTVLIPAVHGGVADGWVKLTHVVVTERDITATVSFNIFDHPSIRVDRMSGELSLSGWNREFAARCHNF